jgi:hypothetical protein
MSEPSKSYDKDIESLMVTLSEELVQLASYNKAGKPSVDDIEVAKREQEVLGVFAEILCTYNDLRALMGADLERRLDEPVSQLLQGLPSILLSVDEVDVGILCETIRAGYSVATLLRDAQQRISENEWKEVIALGLLLGLATVAAADGGTSLAIGVLGDHAVDHMVGSAVRIFAEDVRKAEGGAAQLGEPVSDPPATDPSPPGPADDLPPGLLDDGPPGPADDLPPGLLNDGPPGPADDPFPIAGRHDFGRNSGYGNRNTM